MFDYNFKLFHMYVNKCNRYYNFCLYRFRISDSLKTKNDLDLELAKEQHKQYCSLLREIGLDVIELPPDDDLPESVFVETSTIICNGVALIAKSNDPMRQKAVFL